MTSAAHSKTVRDLRQQLVKSQTTSIDQQILPTGIRSLDRLLPEGGLPTASVVEWVSDAPGLSATSIALTCVAEFIRLPGAFAVLDPDRKFHPIALPSFGIPLSRLLLIHPAERSDVLWSLEQVARCSGVRVVMADVDGVSTTALRRLQLAVERSGVTVFLMRPASALRQSSWADLRFRIQCVKFSKRIVDNGDPVRRLTVQLVHSRNVARQSGRVVLKVDDETGDVCEVSELAGAASAQ